MSEHDELFRYCVHCDADCEVDDPEHAVDCPSNTGIYPIRDEEAFRCPHCGKSTRETTCMDCGVSLNVGDYYALRDASTGEMAVRPDVGEVICLGCAARIGLIEA